VPRGGQQNVNRRSLDHHHPGRRVSAGGRRIGTIGPAVNGTAGAGAAGNHLGLARAPGAYDGQVIVPASPSAISGDPFEERDWEILWGGRRGSGNFVAASNRWSAAMPQPNDPGEGVLSPKIGGDPVVTPASLFCRRNQPILPRFEIRLSSGGGSLERTRLRSGRFPWLAGKIQGICFSLPFADSQRCRI